MLRKARILAVFAALFVAACVPETETFLSDPGEQPIDARVLGTWYTLERDGREAVILTVRRTRDQRISVIWTELKPRNVRSEHDRPVQFVRYTGFTTQIDKANFVNLRLVDRRSWKSGAPTRFIMRYWLTKEGLRIAFMKDDVFKKAVKTGKLAGRLTEDDVLITAKREALIAFIREVGVDKAFAKPTKPLHRLAPTDG